MLFSHCHICVCSHRAASWRADCVRRRQRWERRRGQREPGRADHWRGQAAGVHRGHRRRLLGHPHGLQPVDLLPPQEEEGAEPLHGVLRLHTSRSGWPGTCGSLLPVCLMSERALWKKPQEVPVEEDFILLPQAQEMELGFEESEWYLSEVKSGLCDNLGVFYR